MSGVVNWPGIEVTLGGHKYVVPPLPLSFIEQHEDLQGDDLETVPASLIIDAVHASLQRNYPEMSRADVAGLLDVGNMAPMFELTMDASATRRKEGAKLTGKSNPPWDLVSGGWMSSSTSRPKPVGRSKKFGR